MNTESFSVLMPKPNLLWLLAIALLLTQLFYLARIVRSLWLKITATKIISRTNFSESLDSGDKQK